MTKKEKAKIIKIIKEAKISLSNGAIYGAMVVPYEIMEALNIKEQEVETKEK